LIEVLELKH